jgi:hypothetical protein
MMRRIVWTCFSGIVGVGLLLGGHDELAAQPACKFYKTIAPILDARADPAKAGGYVDILEKDEVACITQQKKIGRRQWGYVAHKLLKDGATKPIKGWVGLRFMVLQKSAAAPTKAAEPSKSAATPKTAKVQPVKKPAGLSFTKPVEVGPFPVRGNSLKDLALGSPIFSPIEGLPKDLWQKKCTSCHKWNQKRLCDQGSSYIKAAAAVFRHQHPYGGPYKLALMRWAKSGCK